MILFRDCLTEEEAREISELTASANACDGTNYAAPLDADLYFLYREETGNPGGGAGGELRGGPGDELRRSPCHGLCGGPDCRLDGGAEEAPDRPAETRPPLLSVLAVYHMGDTHGGKEIDEISAFTHPGCRRRGCFRALFEAAKGLFRPAVRFAVYENAPALACLRALSAKRINEEYFMELLLKEAEAAAPPSAAEDAEKKEAAPHPFPAVSQNAARSGSRTVGRLRTNEVPDLTLSVRPISGDAAAVTCRYGECYLADFGARRYLYGMLIYERFRGRGFGYALLRTLFASLQNEGLSSVFLEVSSENLPAVRLYQKLGFRIKERISYYLLEPKPEKQDT